MFVETDQRQHGEVTVSQVLSLAGLVAWLETQPPETTFEYQDNHDCLMCRYLRARGIEVMWMGGAYFFSAQDDHHDLPFEMGLAAQVEIFTGQNTYAAALVRARGLLHLEAP